MNITTKQLPEAIMDVLYARLVPYISGSPGVGKSDIVRQVANNLNLHLIDVRLSQMDSTDLNGLPAIHEGKTTYTPPKVFPIEGDPIPKGKDGFLILLDELSSASLATQAASYRLILDRMVGQYKLHDRVAIVAAGNKATDKAIVNRMSTAMQSRMIHFNLIVNHKDWLEWANTAGIDTRITSFIEFRPELLHNFNPNHTDNTYSSPRTWQFVNNLIKDKLILSLTDTIILAGTVGEGAAREFKGYTEIYESLPTIKSITANPTGIPIKETPDILYAFTGLISANMNEKNIEALTKFIERLPLDFQIVTWINSIKRNKELYALPAVKQWIKTHAKETLI
jgi:hypothetical protein